MPGMIEGVAASLTVAGERATSQMAAALKQLHMKAIANPDAILAAKRQWDAQVSAMADEWETAWKDWADDDLATFYQDGIQTADGTLSEMGLPPREPVPNMGPSFPAKNAGPVSSLVPPEIQKTFEQYTPTHYSTYSMMRNKAYNALNPTRTIIIRAADDVYRTVAVSTSQMFYREAQTYTRRAFSQEMLNNFAKRGIHGITYKNGARVSLEAYSEMVGRTMTAQTAIEARHLRQQERGYDLVRITSHV